MCRLKYTTEEFIEIANKIHKNKYDYNNTKYTGKHNKIVYICPFHGIIKQTAHNHVYNKAGCYLCGLEKLKNSRRKSKEVFIEEANSLHEDRYDYSMVNYKNNRTKIKIFCKEHGMFEITPNNHLNLLQGCKKCKI